MKLAIFDFDGTLVKTDTLPFLLKIWSSLGYSKLRQIKIYLSIGGLYLRYKLGLNGRMTREQMKKTAFQKFTRIFKGMSRQQISGFFSKSLEFMLPQINEGIALEAKKAKQEGYYTVLLSGFYQELLSMIAQKIEIDTALGTSMHFNNDIIEERKPMNIRTGTDKVVRIKEEFENADFENSCAYADSFSDLELLELVGIPVAVSPDEKLKKIALDRNWRVMD